MKTKILIALTFTLALQSLPACAAGLWPWSFEMSKEEVQAFAEQGPYKSFSNGDLETYNGVFDGHKENVQFFFGPAGLRRIGVYVYEGTDKDAARVGFRKAYDSLAKLFGPVEVPGIAVGPGSEPVGPEALAVAALANTAATGKTQMAPVKQPNDMRVFSTFARHQIQGKEHYVVIVYLDKPQ
jgi:hypothetical protein